MTRLPFSGQTLAHAPLDLGEGPSYEPETDTAWWFDIVGKALIEWRMGEGTQRLHALPVMASVAARVDGDRQILATERGLMLRERKTGELSLVTAIEEANPATRSNDGRVHPSGALWLGTMGKNAEREAGAIYHVAAGVVTKLYDRITIPNAICFSPDGAAAWFTDTATARMMRVAVDPATGLPAGEPTLFVDHGSEPGALDGSVCDADGTIWNARWGAGCVDAYSPDGKRVRSLEVPAGQPSCPAFIGRNADRLLVTTARQGLDEEALAADPDAGKTFVLDFAVKGRFEPAYRL